MSIHHIIQRRVLAVDISHSSGVFAGVRETWNAGAILSNPKAHVSHPSYAYRKLPASVKHGCVVDLQNACFVRGGACFLRGRHALMYIHRNDIIPLASSWLDYLIKAPLTTQKTSESCQKSNIQGRCEKVFISEKYNLHTQWFIFVIQAIKRCL